MHFYINLPKKWLHDFIIQLLKRSQLGALQAYHAEKPPVPTESLQKKSYLKKKIPPRRKLFSADSAGAVQLVAFKLQVQLF